MTKTKDPLTQVELIEKLRVCSNFDEIDDLLDALGFEANDMDGRIACLNKIMVVTASFHNNVSLEQRYINAKHSLISQLWRT